MSHETGRGPEPVTTDAPESSFAATPVAGTYRFMTNPLRAMSLKTRVPLVVVGFILAGIWGLAAHLSGILQRDIERLISNQLSTQVRFLADEVDEELRMRLNLLQEIAAQI